MDVLDKNKVMQLDRPTHLSLTDTPRHMHTHTHAYTYITQKYMCINAYTPLNVRNNPLKATM